MNNRSRKDLLIIEPALASQSRKLLSKYVHEYVPVFRRLDYSLGMDYAEHNAQLDEYCAEVSAVFDDAAWIVEIDVGATGYDSDSYSRETLDRSRRLVTAMMRLLYNHQGLKLPMPRISPADSGSIDLLWEYESAILVVNIPADSEELVVCHMKDSGTGESFTGEFGDLRESAVGLLSNWVTEAW